MAMREECVHYQSRTYSNGEVVRFCTLGLAPEAPWRCPENCSKFKPRLADVGFERGSLIEPPVEDEPEVKDLKSAIELLDEAEKIVNNEALAQEKISRSSRFRKFFRKN